jgi:hypothetical protein
MTSTTPESTSEVAETPRKQPKPKLNQKERLAHAAEVHRVNMEKAEARKKELEKKEAENQSKGAKRAEKTAASVKAKEEAKAAKEKAKAEAKAAKKKAKGEKSTAPRAFGTSPNKGKEIVVLTEGGKNPRREGTNGFNSFALLEPGMIYDDYIKAGGRSVDLNYDIEHGYVKVVDVPAVEAAAAE